jgi:hypothetical protein
MAAFVREAPSLLRLAWEAASDPDHDYSRAQAKPALEMTPTRSKRPSPPSRERHHLPLPRHIPTPPVTGIAGASLGGVRCLENTAYPSLVFQGDESVTHSAWRCAR